MRPSAAPAATAQQPRAAVRLIGRRCAWADKQACGSVSRSSFKAQGSWGQRG